MSKTNISVNVFNPGKAVADSGSSHSWVKIGERSDSVTIFTDNLEGAEKIAAALNEVFGHE